MKIPSHLPKLPRGFRLPKGLHDRVSEIYQDDDGWWCDFAEGWVWNGQTGVREDTKSRLIATIRDAAKGEEF